MKQQMERVWELQDELETATALDDHQAMVEIGVELAEATLQLKEFEKEL